MRKISVKMISAIASLIMLPCSCMAEWRDPNIKAAYESAFGHLYISSCDGLRSLIYLLTSKHPRTLGLTNIENMQNYLEDNFQALQPKFQNITREALDKEYSTHFNRSSMAQESIKNFDYKRKEGIKDNIRKAFGRDLTRAQLLAVAQVLEVTLKEKNIPIASLTSIMKHGRVDNLLYWYDINWDIIAPVAPSLTLVWGSDSDTESPVTKQKENNIEPVQNKQ